MIPKCWKIGIQLEISMSKWNKVHHACTITMSKGSTKSIMALGSYDLVTKIQCIYWYVRFSTRTIPCWEQITPASSLWSQLWMPTPLWVQSSRFVSSPRHSTLSKKISPVPGPEMILLFAPLSAIASASCTTKMKLQSISCRCPPPVYPWCYS